MATQMLTHGHRICAQFFSVGPFAGSRKDEHLVKGLLLL